jgi:hypothetical protein
MVYLHVSRPLNPVNDDPGIKEIGSGMEILFPVSDYFQDFSAGGAQVPFMIQSFSPNELKDLLVVHLGDDIWFTVSCINRCAYRLVAIKR